jgi:hypothetical protein
MVFGFGRFIDEDEVETAGGVCELFELGGVNGRNPPFDFDCAAAGMGARASLGDMAGA